MREQHADKGYRKFWPMMKEMTWKERFTHIIYYYGKFIILGAFLIYMLTDVLIDAYKPKPEVILSGTAINVHISVDMEKKLTEDPFTAIGGTDAEKQEIKLVPNTITNSDLHMVSTLQTKMLAGDFHYVLMDQVALDMVINMQGLPDITLVLSEEALAPWADRFISVQTDGETYPVALDISGTPLAKGCTFEGERLFLGFPVNMDNLAVVEPFFAYLTEQGLLETP